MSEALAYLLTWTTYGTWPQGDRRGWVDRHNAGPGMEAHPANAAARIACEKRTGGAAVILGDEERRIVEEAVQGVCRHRDWQLIALNCRTNHVHVLVRTDGTPPERVMTDFKAYATRALKARGFAYRRKVWTRHGSTRYINSPASLTTAEQYVRWQ